MKVTYLKIMGVACNERERSRGEKEKKDKFP